MTANLLTLNSSRLNSCSSDSKPTCQKRHKASLDTSHFAWNLGLIFDEHLTFSNQITSLSKACCYHIHQLRCIRPYLDSSTACIIVTSIVHSKLDYSNFLYHKLHESQLSRVQQIQNSLARTIVKALKLCHVTSILRSLYWLRITERIEYKILSLTCKVFTTTQHPYLHNLISVQRPRSIRSLSVVTLARPPTSSSQKITDRSFRYALPCLWNNSILVSVSPFLTHLFLHPSLPLIESPLFSSITPSLFHFRLKPVSQILTRSFSRIAFHGILPFLLSYSLFCLQFSFFSFLCRALN